MLIFGPVPSRRLGYSIGINNIPPKTFTYSCVYCQLGRTKRILHQRQPFHEPNTFGKEINKKIEKTTEKGITVDYLTFVPDGEPTLDINLGREIESIRPFGIKIAVITNASLIWRSDVREDLMKADWVSLKVDTIQEKMWRRINRPHEALKFKSILDGIFEFASDYSGELVTETMLLNGINDDNFHNKNVANFLAQLKPNKAYISIPIRPPAENWVHTPSEESINQAYQVFSEKIDNVECLIGYEGNQFVFTGNIKEDLLSIMAVHPMREDAVGKLLIQAKKDWSIIQRLIANGSVIETEYK